MNSLQSLWVEKTGAIARQKNAVGVHAWNREITTGCDCLRAVTDHLAAVKQARDVWMSFEALKLCMRIDKRVLVIESGHVADIQDAVLHAVNPTAAVCG